MQILFSLFGGAFTLLTAYSLGSLLLRRPTPAEIKLALGAITASSIVFVLLLANAAHWGVFLAIGAVAISFAWRVRRGPAKGGPEAHPTMVIFGAYGLWYFVNALAPEITPDGITY